jgi:hypothetical protein
VASPERRIAEQENGKRKRKKRKAKKGYGQ